MIRSLLEDREFVSYHEPFVGGASVFLGLEAIREAFLRDVNRDLIATYEAIRDRPEFVARLARSYPNDSETYYRVRSSNPSNRFERAARFIYLNHTSFNGIYRVNLRGEYNVPFGRRTSPQIPTVEHLRATAEKLRVAQLDCGDFQGALDRISPGDIVFLDPPYTVAHNQNGFIKYNERLFSFDDQKRLSEFVDEVKRRGAFYILTNACHESIKELFDKGDLMIETVRRNVVGGARAARGTAVELLFTNLSNR